MQTNISLYLLLHFFLAGYDGKSYKKPTDWKKIWIIVAIVVAAVVLVAVVGMLVWKFALSGGSGSGGSAPANYVLQQN